MDDVYRQQYYKGYITGRKKGGGGGRRRYE